MCSVKRFIYGFFSFMITVICACNVSGVAYAAVDTPTQNASIVDDGLQFETDINDYGDMWLTRSFDTPNYEIVSGTVIDGTGDYNKRSTESTFAGSDLNYYWIRTFRSSGVTSRTLTGAYVKFTLPSAAEFPEGAASQANFYDKHFGNEAFIIKFPDMMLDKDGKYHDLYLGIAQVRLEINEPFLNALRKLANADTANGAPGGSNEVLIPLFVCGINGDGTTLRIGSHPEDVRTLNNVAPIIRDGEAWKFVGNNVVAQNNPDDGDDPAYVKYYDGSKYVSCQYGIQFVASFYVDGIDEGKSFNVLVKSTVPNENDSKQDNGVNGADKLRSAFGFTPASAPSVNTVWWCPDSHDDKIRNLVSYYFDNDDTTFQHAINNNQVFHTDSGSLASSNTTGLVSGAYKITSEGQNRYLISNSDISSSGWREVSTVAKMGQSYDKSMRMEFTEANNAYPGDLKFNRPSHVSFVATDGTYEAYFPGVREYLDNSAEYVKDRIATNGVTSINWWENVKADDFSTSIGYQDAIVEQVVPTVGKYILFKNISTRGLYDLGWAVSYRLLDNQSEPVRKNHILREWNTKADGSGLAFKTGQPVSMEDIIGSEANSKKDSYWGALYAQWDLNPYAQTAYAVLLDDGTLVFCRSEQTYTNGSRQSVVDIAGNTWQGIVFTNVETMTCASVTAVPWNSYRNSIKSVKVADQQMYQPGDCRYMFANCPNLTTLDLSGFDTGGEFHTGSNNTNPKKITSMAHMFENSPQIQSLDLYSFDTDEVTDFSSMFKDCINLNDLFVRSFDTTVATNMSSMFEDCTSMKKLDLRSFSTPQISNTSNMFKNCDVLESVDIRNMGGNNLANAVSMFENCKKLGSIDIGNLATKSNIDARNMFKNCESITSLDLSKFDTTTNTSGNAGMFDGTKQLSSITLGSNFRFKDARLMDAAEYSSNPTWYDRSKWMKAGTTTKYNPIPLATNYDVDSVNLQGTWVWAPSVADSTGDGDAVIYFDPTGGTVSVSSVSDKMSSGGYVRVPTPKRAGYIFDSWMYTKPDGTEIVVDAGDDIGIKAIVADANNCTEEQALGRAAVLKVLWTPEPPYTLGDATYRIYTDSTCTSEYYTGVELVTDADGNAGPVTLPVGTYWIKERIASNGYGLDTVIHKIVITGDGTTDIQTEHVTSEEPPLWGRIKVLKESSNPAVTSQDPKYSFEGAQYYLYEDQACNVRAKDKTGAYVVLTTDAMGESNESKDIRAGDYYLREVKAPDCGYYGLDSKPVLISIRNNQTLPVHHVEPVELTFVSFSVVKKLATGTVANNRFVFDITLRDNNNANLPDGTYGDLTLTNGTGSFTLGVNDSIYVCDLPVGTKYVITERSAGTGWSTTWTGGGTIDNANRRVSGQLNDVTVSPTFTATNSKQTGNLALVKRVSNTDEDYEYPFTITINDGATGISGTYAATSTAGRFNNVKFVNGKALITLVKDEQVVISGLPNWATFSIVENVEALPNGSAGWTVTWNRTPSGTISSTATLAQYQFTCTNQKTEGKARLLKRSANPEITNTANDVLYNLEGVEYTMYDSLENARKAQQAADASNNFQLSTDGYVGTLITDSTGYSQELEVLPGTYYVIETNANTEKTGLLLDTTPVGENNKIVVLDNQTKVITQTDRIVGYVPPILIQKVDSFTGNSVPQGNASLENALFSIEYYNELKENVSGSSTPLRTWYVKTDGLGQATLSDTYLSQSGSYIDVGTGTRVTYTSDAVWRDSNDEIIVPRGTIRITELSPSLGYIVPTLSSVRTRYVAVDGTSDWEATAFNEQHTDEGILESKLYGRKVDALTGEPLNGARFTVTNASTNAVIYNGVSYAPGEVMATLVSSTLSNSVAIPGGYTDRRGWIYLANIPYGTYELREIEAPENYVMNSNAVSTVTIDGTTDGVVVIEIENRSAAIVLPQTGLEGIGYIAGISMIIASIGAVGWYKRKVSNA